MSVWNATCLDGRVSLGGRRLRHGSNTSSCSPGCIHFKRWKFLYQTVYPPSIVGILTTAYRLSHSIRVDGCFELLNRQPTSSLGRNRRRRGPHFSVRRSIFRGCLPNRVVRKPESGNIIVHCSSAHPFSTKRAVVQNIFRTTVSSRKGSTLWIFIYLTI